MTTIQKKIVALRAPINEIDLVRFRSEKAHLKACLDVLWEFRVLFRETPSIYNLAHRRILFDLYDDAEDSFANWARKDCFGATVPRIEDQSAMVEGYLPRIHVEALRFLNLAEKMAPTVFMFPATFVSAIRELKNCLSAREYSPEDFASFFPKFQRVLKVFPQAHRSRCFLQGKFQAAFEAIAIRQMLQVWKVYYDDKVAALELPMTIPLVAKFKRLITLEKQSFYQQFVKRLGIDEGFISMLMNKLEQEIAKQTTRTQPKPENVLRLLRAQINCVRGALSNAESLGVPVSADRYGVDGVSLYSAVNMSVVEGFDLLSQLPTVRVLEEYFDAGDKISQEWVRGTSLEGEIPESGKYWGKTIVGLGSLAILGSVSWSFVGGMAVYAGINRLFGNPDRALDLGARLGFSELTLISHYDRIRSGASYLGLLGVALPTTSLEAAGTVTIFAGTSLGARFGFWVTDAALDCRYRDIPEPPVSKKLRPFFRVLGGIAGGYWGTYVSATMVSNLMAPVKMGPAEARRILGLNSEPQGPGDIKRAYRAAARCANSGHPDKGGSRAAFVRIVEARDLLNEYYRWEPIPGPRPQPRPKTA